VDSALRLDTAGSPRDGLIGQSAAMSRVREVIAKVARSQAPVFISGESGTGKELVAAMIHRQGPRHGAPFVPVNCGAIPGELMESEFFGHKKGAFTGAVSDQPGLFRSAEGGTLFLDEIADLPLPMQVKLLRVIQEKKVRPIGGREEVPVDVRILSASHKDLAALVSSGAFREDLFYRINVIELAVPPLRDREGDVFLLVDHILDKLATEMGIPAPELDAAARARLERYRFPGNVRELENVLERALTLCDASVISADDIQVTADETDPAFETQHDLGNKLESIERDTIVRALEDNRYNKTAAAKQLGITLRALRYRIQKLGIE